MGTFASHGSRQSSGKPLFRSTSANLDDWRGGQPKPSPTYKLPRSFTLLLRFRPCMSWFKREEGSWKSQTTRPSYHPRVPFL